MEDSEQNNQVEEFVYLEAAGHNLEAAGHHLDAAGHLEAAEHLEDAGLDEYTKEVQVQLLRPAAPIKSQVQLLRSAASIQCQDQLLRSAAPINRHDQLLRPAVHIESQDQLLRAADPIQRSAPSHSHDQLLRTPAPIQNQDQLLRSAVPVQSQDQLLRSVVPIESQDQLVRPSVPPLPTQTTRVRIPWERIQYCPICGAKVEGSEQRANHIRACLEIEEQPSIHSIQKDPPPAFALSSALAKNSPLLVDTDGEESSTYNEEAKRELKCPTCSKVYVSLRHLEKHRFFCDTAVNLSDFEVNSPAKLPNKKSSREKQDQVAGEPLNRIDELDPDQYTPVHSVSFSALDPSEMGMLSATAEATEEPATTKQQVGRRKVELVPAKPTNPHQCNICRKVFKVASYLKKHLDTTHNPAKKEVCPYCSVGFKDKTSLKNHIRSHTDERPFHCQECPKSFRRKESLEYHKSSHRPVRSIICSHCAKTFRTARDLRSHELLIHPMAADVTPRRRQQQQQQHSAAADSTDCPSKNYTCKTCRLAFKTKIGLDEHRMLNHGLQVFMCRVCGKKFSCASQLDQHSAVHTGVKPFSCTYCGKAFKRKSHKELHEKRHTLSGEFVCPQCNKRFPQQSELMKHLRIHSYKCDVCHLHCSTKTGLKEHMQTHDPLNIIDSDLMQQQALQTISVKTEKFKSLDDTITTKTVYVMEPDVPSHSVPPGSGNVICSPYTLGVPQFRSDKEVGATIVIPAASNQQPQGTGLVDPLTDIKLHQYM